MDLDTAIDEFVVSLRSERGLSPNTVAAYARDLRQYREQLAAGAAPPDPITAEHVSGYVRQLTDDGLAASTIARKVAAVRGLHRFLVIEGLSPEDPTIWVAAPRRPAPLPKALTIEQVTRLLEMPDTDTRLGSRDAALLEFLYATGARVSEAVGVEVVEVDLLERTALLTGKGNRQRMVPLGVPAAAAIGAYLPERLELKGDRADPGVLFVNARGGPLTRQGAWQIVRKHARRAGLPAKKVSPHVLRHSAATHMVEGGADLRSVQEILGHASISTTQVYTRVSPQHLYEVFVSSHPRSR